MLVNYTTAKGADSSDLYSSLSTNYKNNPDNKTIINKSFTPKKKVALDSSACLSVKKCVACHVFKADRVRNHSLIVRWESGGIICEDPRVYFNHPDIQVDIRGIDNHEIKYTHIVVAGGVTKSTIVDIIIIIHQCAYYYKGYSIHSSEQMDHFKNYVEDKLIFVGGK